MNHPYPAKGAREEGHRVRCREIEAPDLGRVVDLLTEGYGLGKRDLWLEKVARLSEHCSPPSFPKYGYLLEHSDTLIGSIFTIFSKTIIEGESKIRCSLANWYVRPKFRSHAAFLASRALKYRDVTYLHINPRRDVIPLLRAQGYKQYCSGQFMALPLLSLKSQVALVRPIGVGDSVNADFESWEGEILRVHAGYGCISLVCEVGSERYPFVFAPRFKRGVPFVRLIYCRDIGDFIRFVQPLGRFLARRGFFLVALDANEPIKSLVGGYFDRFPKFFKGPDQPRLGDLAYTARVVLDF